MCNDGRVRMLMRLNISLQCVRGCTPTIHRTILFCIMNTLSRCAEEPQNMSPYDKVDCTRPNYANLNISFVTVLRSCLSKKQAEPNLQVNESMCLSQVILWSKVIPKNFV